MENSTTLPSTSRITLHTPRCTPRLKFNLVQQLLTQNAENDINTLEEIISLTWNIYGVSTLFGFKHNDKTVLKLYGKRLREEIATSLPQENVAYNARISIAESTSDTMYLPLIKVEVHAKKLDQEDSIEKSIYLGLFLSWKTNCNLNTDNSDKLPLLLCRGTRTCTNVVHSTLSRMFDCLIIALPIKEDDLMWLLPIILIPANEEEYPNKKEEVRLEYVVPGLSTPDTITVKFSSLDLIKILNVIITNLHNEMEKEISIEHIKRFRKCLQVHMRKIAGLELGLCTLHRISLPAATMMGNKMKVTDSETMKRVLLYMTEKALVMFHALLL